MFEPCCLLRQGFFAFFHGCRRMPCLWWAGVVVLGLAGCHPAPLPNAKPLFNTLNHEQTGLHFANKLTPTAAFNMFKYMYFYNGAGVAAADFNNDSLVDLFFASNQGQNTLYLNKGGLRFTDVTRTAQIPTDSGWSTGVSVVDINNDGMMDVYVCRVSSFERLSGNNQLLVCQSIVNGVPTYADEAKKYGLDFSGFSTQSAFLDYDLDGDLDMYLLNHAIDHNGRFAERDQFLGTYDSLSGDKLYRNDQGHFTDVTRQCGINSSAIGYGLGIAVSDVNLDGWPDIYIGNDFHENDYLYINQRNGRFADEATLRTMHTSQFSMGVDIADVTNDGFPEIISLDMLPQDPYILKRSLGEDTYDIFKMKLRFGYHPYFTRNNLQLNRRNGLFSETGLYSGVAATDWSWAALWMDFDNDAQKDLFISNGIPKRLNDMDYVNFIGNKTMQAKIVNNQLNDSDFAIINTFPEIKLPNCFFSNTGNARFADIGAQVAANTPTFSNGSVYADFDNDGDLDIVVNNIADAALLYQNTANDSGKSAYADLVLLGSPKNRNAVGAKMVLFCGANVMTYEKTPVHGFLSSMEIPLHVGLKNQKIDSGYLVWPDNSCQPVSVSTLLGKKLLWQPGLPAFNYNLLLQRYPLQSFTASNLAQTSGLSYLHTENVFQEFNRETLLPQMASTEGPALAVSDINGDGLEDVFVGAARDGKPAVFLQLAKGRFAQVKQPALEADSAFEDVDACWTDVNGDHFPDLVVASGGNEFYGTHPLMAPRLYLNNGKGLLAREADAFAGVYATASCVVATDFNGDGANDLFLGARCTPFSYGSMPKSYWLQNDGKGHFADVSAKVAGAEASPGLVTGAAWTDLDADGDTDLLVACHWQPILVYLNTKGRFTRQALGGESGWWNMVLPFDADGDGDLDVLAGNAGLNNRLLPSPATPVRLYLADFDGNGNTEQLMTYYLQGKEVPFANKDELQKQMPGLKKTYLYAADFAKATLTDIIAAQKLKAATTLSASSFASALFINQGNLAFTPQALPWQAQLSAIRVATLVQANADALPDLLVAGNFYDYNIQLGRNDADFGTVLLNKGGGRFDAEPLNGVAIKGQVRRMLPLQLGKKPALVMARNNDSLVLLQFGIKRN